MTQTKIRAVLLRNSSLVLTGMSHYRSSHRRYSIKKGLRLATLSKKRLWHRYFPVSFVKFSRAPFLQNSSRRLLLPLKKKTFKGNKNNQTPFITKELRKEIYTTLHKKWSFPLRVSSVNVTKSAVACGFGHIYWRNP